MAGSHREDLWEMKVKRWQQKAVNKEEQASIIKETKAVRPYSQGVINQISKYSEADKRQYNACVSE